MTALDLAIDEHFDKLKANNKEIQNQLQRFTDLPLNAKFSNICLLLNLCSEKEIEQSLDVIKTRNKIVHEGYVIENDENPFSFYIFARIITKIINISPVVFPKQLLSNHLDKLP